MPSFPQTKKGKTREEENPIFCLVLIGAGILVPFVSFFSLTVLGLWPRALVGRLLATGGQKEVLAVQLVVTPDFFKKNRVKYCFLFNKIHLFLLYLLVWRYQFRAILEVIVEVAADFALL